MTVPARIATLVAMLEPLSGAVFAVPLATLMGGGLVLLGVYLNRR